MIDQLNKEREAGNISVYSTFNDIFLKIQLSLRDVTF